MVRRELVRVVEHGTGRRVAGGVKLADGRTLEIGGKTGTDDNRFETVGPQGRTSRVVNRTAAFALSRDPPRERTRDAVRSAPGS